MKFRRGEISSEFLVKVAIAVALLLVFVTLYFLWSNGTIPSLIAQIENMFRFGG